MAETPTEEGDELCATCGHLASLHCEYSDETAAYGVLTMCDGPRRPTDHEWRSHCGCERFEFGAPPQEPGNG